MTDFFQFLLKPYEDALTINIVLEVIAATLGIISVFYARAENIRVYPTGIISTAIYVYLLSQWDLYGDLIINIYYTLMSIYGWYMWTKVVGNNNEHIVISKTTKSDKLKTLGIFLFSTAFVLAVYRYFQVIPTDLGVFDGILYVYDNIVVGNIEKFKLTVPFLDAFTTGAAFSAMWLLANKKIENWLFWIAVNVVSVPLYFIKGFGFTGIQYFVFLVLAVLGYLEWKKRIKFEVIPQQKLVD